MELKKESPKKYALSKGRGEMDDETDRILDLEDKRAKARNDAWWKWYWGLKLEPPPEVGDDE